MTADRFGRGGHIDRPQFAFILRAVGWTIFGEFRSTLSRSGVSQDDTPLRLTKTSNSKRSMQPPARTNLPKCRRCVTPPHLREALNSELFSRHLMPLVFSTLNAGGLSQELSQLMSSRDLANETAI